ncbi:hypothetical protein V6N13_048668 [Hibiscus sabdariffa]
MQEKLKTVEESLLLSKQQQQQRQQQKLMQEQAEQQRIAKEKSERLIRQLSRGSMGRTVRGKHADEHTLSQQETQDIEDDYENSEYIEHILIESDEQHALLMKMKQLEKDFQSIQNLEHIYLSQSSRRYKNEPLSINILEHRVPTSFKVPNLMYNGKRDPQNHLSHFLNHIDLFGALNQVKCRTFSMTLKDSAQAWYLQLPTNSISNFDQLADLLESLISKQGIKKIASVPHVCHPKSK